jgi:hypothetical protein
VLQTNMPLEVEHVARPIGALSAGSLRHVRVDQAHVPRQLRLPLTRIVALAATQRFVQRVFNPVSIQVALKSRGKIASRSHTAKKDGCLTHISIGLPVMTFQMRFVAVDRAVGPMTDMATMGSGSRATVAFSRRQMATLHMELQKLSLVRGIGAGARAGEQVWSRVDLTLVSGQTLHCLKLSVITGLTFQPFYAAAVEALNRGIGSR